MKLHHLLSAAIIAVPALHFGLWTWFTLAVAVLAGVWIARSTTRRMTREGIERRYHTRHALRAHVV